jgi:hypothetical protein
MERREGGSRRWLRDESNTVGAENIDLLVLELL